jgi:hypothetical protein
VVSLTTLLLPTEDEKIDHVALMTTRNIEFFWLKRKFLISIILNLNYRLMHYSGRARNSTLGQHYAISLHSLSFGFP